jgi:triosephosphate isomerase
MKPERCPLCDSALIEEVQFVRKESDGSGSSRYEGSIDILTGGSMNVENVRKVIRCPNPECGYLNTDC